MKLAPTIILGLLLITSCQSPEIQSKEPVINKESSSKSIAIPQSLAKIYTPNNGVLRGVEFLTSIDEVRKQENADLEESDKGFLRYSTDLNDKDFADITYYFKNEQLNKIQLDIFTDKPATSEQIFNEIKNFFDQKYKTRKSLWEGTENGKTFTIYTKKLKDGVYVVYELI